MNIILTIVVQYPSQSYVNTYMRRNEIEKCVFTSDKMTLTQIENEMIEGILRLLSRPQMLYTINHLTLKNYKK